MLAAMRADSIVDRMPGCVLTINRLIAPVISPDDGRVTVRVIPTDEDLMIATFVARVLNLGSIRKG
jgi:hypothetical protein